MATKIVTMKRSAMSSNAKYASLTQQCFQRFHNTCDNTSSQEKVKILNEFMYELYISGYNERDRFEILKGGYTTYEKLKEKESKGLRPFYRPRSFEKDSRQVNKINKKNNRFKNKSKSDIQYSSVMFVESTPNDELLKLCKNIESKYKISDKDRIKFVSKTGTKLGKIVQKRNPFEENCSD